MVVLNNSYCKPNQELSLSMNKAEHKFIRVPSVVFFALLLITVSSIRAQGTWLQVSAIPLMGGRTSAVAFSISGKGYMGTGIDGTFGYFQDLWEYDPISGTWTQKADFGGGPRAYATGFSIGNYGYIGTGENDNNATLLNDFWKYDPLANTWSRAASVSSIAREAAVGFAVGGKGYIGTGQTGQSGYLCLEDMWEYDPLTNSWVQKQNFMGGGRTDIDRSVFVIGSKAYLGLGRTCDTLGVPNHFNDWYSFNPVANTWSRMPSLPGAARRGAVGFTLCNVGYVGLGTNEINQSQNDFWMFTPATNSWTTVAPFPGTVRWDQPSFVVGNTAFLGTGTIDDSGWGLESMNDFWKFSVPFNAAISTNSTICIGSNITISAYGGTQYSWNTGDTSSTLNVAPNTTTNYTVAVTAHCNTDTVHTIVSVITSATSAFTYNYEPCTNQCIAFSNQCVNALSYDWNFGDGIHSASPNPCHLYTDSATYPVTLTINASTNCQSMQNMPLNYFAYDTTANVFIPNLFSPNQDGKNDVLKFYRRNSFCLAKFELAIYDRWGEKVFETTDIDASWDGTFKGQPLNSAAFVYSCSLVTQTGVHQEFKGSVSLIR